MRWSPDEVDCGVVWDVSMRFGLALSLSDTKMSDDVAIWVIHLLEEVSSPTEMGDPRTGRGVDGSRGVSTSRDCKV
jgi:hypothetical protein